jgi:hypothetical protein
MPKQAPDYIISLAYWWADKPTTHFHWDLHFPSKKRAELFVKNLNQLAITSTRIPKKKKRVKRAP